MTSIPVSYARDQQAVRLLELPPDLLELIQTSSAPRLAFKSLPAPSAKPSSHGTANAPAAHIVLTTPSKTYQLRQVQTSNSVLLLHPDGDGHGLTITAQCTSALELEDLPTPAPGDPLRPKSALQHLTARLPLYTSPADIDPSPPHDPRTRSTIFADIPFSDAELAAAWALLAAFEAHGQPFRPAAPALHDLWRSILTAATLADIDLAASHALDADALWAVVDTDHPRPLFDAILRRLSIDTDGASRLDADATTLWVAALCRAPEQPTLKNESTAWSERCRALLPEAWRARVTEDLLRARVGNSGGDEDIPASAAPAAAAAGAGAASKDGGAKGPQRNWHERFKKMKR